MERYKQTILFLGVCGIIVQKTGKVPRKPMISSNVASIAREEDVRSSLQSPGTKRVAEPTKASPPTEVGKVAKKNGDISPGSMQSPENKV